MRFSRSALAAAAVSPILAEECIYSLQVLQLQDASASFTDDVNMMVETAGQLIGNITTHYPGSKYGLSSFIDKPVVQHGYGPYGAYGIQNAADYCFKSHLQFTDDVAALQKSLTALAKGVGSGFDNQENQLEALLYAAQDTTVGWAPPDQSHDAEGRPLVRLIIMITDAPPHLEGDYKGTTTNAWMWERVYTPNTAEGTSSGGFGADDFAIKNGKGTGFIDSTYADQYPELAQLFHKIDFGVALTADEQTRYDSLIEMFGPYPWPEYLAKHPGTIGQDCSLVEYPAVDTVGYILRAYSIFPVFLIANPVNDQYTQKACPALGFDTSNVDQLKQCVVALYKQYLSEFETTGYVGELDEGSVDIVSVVMQAISQVVDNVCIGSTPVPVPIPTSNGDGGYTTPKSGGDGGDGGDSGSSEAGDTTTGGAIVPVPAGGSGGTNTAVIAAAGAGGAAAIAAAGFFAYKKFGAGGMGKGAMGDASAVGEVDIPETQVERETIEEVTMDMFQ